MDTMSTFPDFEELTPRQRQMLGFIRDFVGKHGYAPTEREIAAAFRLASKTGPRKHLAALEAAGALTIRQGSARAIRLTGTATNSQGASRSRGQRLRVEHLNLPVLGRVAAGLPIGADLGADMYADADFVQMMLVDRALFHQQPDYLLRVKGDSMRDEGIFDGDLVAIHQTATARHGQIVVARIDDEITIKRLHITKRGIKLLPRNPDYEAIEVAKGADFAIEGLYCGLVRRS